jgi:methyl-accepting chemotaxis protein
MTPKEEIRAELADVANVISTARQALAQNQILDMRGIQDRVRDVANAITDLTPEDAVELRSSLADLLADFKGFAEELRIKIDEIQASGGGVATGKSGG